MCSLQQVDKTQPNFFDLEHIAITTTSNDQFTLEEEEVVKRMEREIFYSPEEKTWYTSLLFKENPTHLGDNFARAKAVIFKVESSAKKNGTIEMLNQAYKDMLDGGFVEKVPAKERHLTDGCHYLQCHPGFRLDKESMKCRIVMNVSAKTAGGCSLNDTLFQGPCLLPDVVHMLIRFRMNLIAYVLDIIKMFLRIKLAKHKDFLRFLWRDCQS